MKNNNSFWLSTSDVPKFDALNDDISSDVCIVGGGITGITTAYYLSKLGYSVTLIEKDLLMSKTSGHTTAKITSQHGLFYKYLLDSQGKDFATKYLKTNESAIKNIENIINEEHIECDFERKSAYVFAENEKELAKVKEEVDVVSSLGVVKCSFVDNVKLNLNISGAIEFKNQAQFNPIKYTSGLIKSIINNNSSIYENTCFVDYEKNDGEFTVFTNTNHKIKSKYLVLATRYPIVNFTGFYFLKMYQELSYVIAIKPTAVFNIDGMYINSGVPSLSIKTAKYNGEDVIFVGGYTDKTGSNTDLSNKYDLLIKKAQEIFGDFEVLYKWDTEDCISLDKIPYIGEFSALTNNLFLATGYEKWGMTTSNVAANIIVDKITGNKNEFEDVFKATRLEPIKNKDELANMVKQSFKSLVIDKFKSPDDILNDLKNDDGKIIMYNNDKIGVYKDLEGKLYAIKPICTHLGCELSWNNLNKTWDCPCHGSRFDYTGKCIYSPAIRDLERYELE